MTTKPEMAPQSGAQPRETLQSYRINRGGFLRWLRSRGVRWPTMTARAYLLLWWAVAVVSAFAVGFTAGYLGGPVIDALVRLVGW